MADDKSTAAEETAEKEAAETAEEKAIAEAEAKAKAEASKKAPRGKKLDLEKDYAVIYGGTGNAKYVQDGVYYNAKHQRVKAPE